MEQNLFGLDENGQIVVEEKIEDEVVENGNDVVEDVVEGDSLPNEMEAPENVREPQEAVVYSLGDEPLAVVLSDEVTTALVEGLTPAGGTLASTTLDYFDRIVSGLPHDYVYCAYRVSADNNTDGVLYYSDNYDLDGDSIVFKGDSATTVRVLRVNSGGYNSNTEYQNYSGDGANVNLSRSGDVVYYTNATVGFPVLGGRTRPISNGSLLGVALAVVLFASALSLLARRFR